MDNKLTIVLPLKDRVQFTWRWMDYANKMKFPWKIIIADGGKDESVEKRMQDKSQYPNLNYEYIRYPYDKDILTFFSKMSDAISRVQTKYVVLADNDDFLFKDALYKSVEFLEKNDDYMSSRGEIYNFHVQGNKENADIYGKITRLSKILYSPSNVGETALERIKVFSKNSDGMWQDVCRSENLKDCYKSLIQTGISDFDMCDHLINYLRSIYGKVNREEGLFMLHQSHAGGLGHAIIKSDPTEWILSNRWSENILKFFDVIAQRIVDEDGSQKEIAMHTIMQYYIGYIIGDIMFRVRIERKIKTQPSKIVTLGRVLSKENKIRKFFKSIYQYTYERKQDKIGLNAPSTTPYYSQINSIQDFLEGKN